MYFLSYLTFITSAVASALPSQPGLAARQSGSLDKGYVFAYFTGDSKSGENISLAASKGNDALDWQELNGGNPILTSTKGTRGLRNPVLMKSPDGKKFFLLATDLSIGSGTSWGDSIRHGPG